MAGVVLFLLNFSFYLGISILVVMITLGLYYCCKYCCCQSCRKRRQREFHGIRAHPSFVRAITVAFQSSAASLQGLIRSGDSGEVREEKAKYNCSTCSLIHQGSYMISGVQCPDCGTSLV